CVMGLAIRHIREQFQQLNTIISKYFRKMLDTFSTPGIYAKYVHLPHTNEPTPAKISDNPKYMPFFKDAISMIDGMHIACTPSAADRESTWNHK
ncbi:hypothetical protein PAXRUDRAFT_60012, partial [Paxillus rubicundulus Ve08.2h10]